MHGQRCGQGLGRCVVCEAVGRASSFSFSLLPAADRVFGTAGLSRAVGTASAFPDGWGRVHGVGALQGWPWFQNLPGSPGGRPPLATCWCEPFDAVSLFVFSARTRRKSCPILSFRGKGGENSRFVLALQSKQAALRLELPLPATASGSARTWLGGRAAGGWDVPRRVHPPCARRRVTATRAVVSAVSGVESRALGTVEAT